MGYFLLAIAILADVLATTALKSSDGFTKLLPSSVAVIGSIISFYLLSIVLRSIPVGITYAIWSGIGILLVASIGFFAFDQRPNTGTSVGIALIISGVVIVNLFSSISEA